jgi:hypothetical protein
MLAGGAPPRSLITAPNANAAIASPQTTPTAARLRLILAAFTARDLRRRPAESAPIERPDRHLALRPNALPDQL